jgi:hypothetical protein
VKGSFTKKTKEKIRKILNNTIKIKEISKIKTKKLK